MIGLVQRLVAWIDGRQRAFAPTAFLVGVVKKYGDDRAGTLSALMTFYGLLAVFPLLLLFVTVVGLFLGNSHLETTLVNSALAQFPVIGSELKSNIHALTRANPLAFVVSALGLLWGCFGITNALQQASATIWGVPRNREAGLPLRLLRGLELLGVMALSVVLSTVLAGASTIGASHFGGSHVALRVGTLVLATGLNIAAYLLAFRILAPKDIAARRLLPGTLLGGIGWTALQAFAGYLIGHQLHRTSQLYGFFAYVLGLIFWLNLGSQLLLYSSELNVVAARHLWPRSLLEPPPGADAPSAPVPDIAPPPPGPAVGTGRVSGAGPRGP
jgi:YihY family inner membrane protein